MSKSKPKIDKNHDDFMAEDDLDADAFLNIKMENFEEEDLFGNNDALMEKFIQVM